MPDTIPSAFRCRRRFRSDAEPGTRRSKAQETAVAIDHPEIAMPEARDAPTALLLGQAYELACQRFADEHLLTAPLDRTIQVHAANLMISVVPRILQARRQNAGRWLPMCRRRRLLEGLMRPLLIVVMAEAIEPSLLLSRRRCGGFGGLLLQCTVHPLVTAVVLRARRRNVARFYAEVQP